MPTISFTKLEIEAIYGAAGNMKDDFEDYFSFDPNVKKLYSAFETGMEKLLKHIPQGRELTPLEEQAHDALNDN